MKLFKFFNRSSSISNLFDNSKSNDALSSVSTIETSSTSKTASTTSHHKTIQKEIFESSSSDISSATKKKTISNTPNNKPVTRKSIKKTKENNKKNDTNIRKGSTDSKKKKRKPKKKEIRSKIAPPPPPPSPFPPPPPTMVETTPRMSNTRKKQTSTPAQFSSQQNKKKVINKKKVDAKKSQQTKQKTKEKALSDSNHSSGTLGTFGSDSIGLCDVFEGKFSDDGSMPPAEYLSDFESMSDSSYSTDCNGEKEGNKSKRRNAVVKVPKTNSMDDLLTQIESWKVESFHLSINLDEKCWEDSKSTLADLSLPQPPENFEKFQDLENLSEDGNALVSEDDLDSKHSDSSDESSNRMPSITDASVAIDDLALPEEEMDDYEWLDGSLKSIPSVSVEDLQRENMENSEWLEESITDISNVMEKAKEESHAKTEDTENSEWLEESIEDIATVMEKAKEESLAQTEDEENSEWLEISINSITDINKTLTPHQSEDMENSEYLEESINDLSLEESPTTPEGTENSELLGESIGDITNVTDASERVEDTLAQQQSENMDDSVWAWESYHQLSPISERSREDSTTRHDDLDNSQWLEQSKLDIPTVKDTWVAHMQQSERMENSERLDDLLPPANQTSPSQDDSVSQADEMEHSELLKESTSDVWAVKEKSMSVEESDTQPEGTKKSVHLTESKVDDAPVTEKSRSVDKSLTKPEGVAKPIKLEQSKERSPPVIRKSIKKPFGQHKNMQKSNRRDVSIVDNSHVRQKSVWAEPEETGIPVWLEKSLSKAKRDVGRSLWLDFEECTVDLVGCY